MPRKKRRNRTRRLIGWSLLAVVLGYLVVLPAVQAVWESRQVRPSVRTLEEMTVAQTMQLRAVEVFTTFWFLAFGACWGSFLNVVAGRLPRGESLLGASRCPYCRVKIPWRDNVPIVGWLVLGGRCRTCRLPIAPRYLLVELLAGAMFVTLAFVELLSGGENLPGGSRYPHYNGFVWILFYTKWDMVRLYAYHATLLCALLAAALMQWDGLRIPRRFVLICAGLGLLIPAIWPDVHPVLWNGAEPRFHVTGSPAWWTRLDTSLIGLLAGTAWGALLGLTTPRGRVGSPPRWPVAEAAFCLGLTGLVLGWQAALSVSLLAAVVALAMALIAAWWKHERAPPLASLFLAAAVLQILLWRWLSSIPFWPGHTAGANSAFTGNDVVLSEGAIFQHPELLGWILDTAFATVASGACSGQ